MEHECTRRFDFLCFSIPVLSNKYRLYPNRWTARLSLTTTGRRCPDSPGDRKPRQSGLYFARDTPKLFARRRNEIEIIITAVVVRVFTRSRTPS